MLSLNRFGLTSLVLGGLAVPVAFSAEYARTSHIPGSGVILQWMASMDLVRQAPNSIATLSETSIFAINDQNAISLLLATAIILSVSSMGCALFAEFRREPTLYLSGGYICGALAIFLIKPSAGFISFMAGIAAVLVLRHGRDGSATR